MIRLNKKHTRLLSLIFFIIFLASTKVFATPDTIKETMVNAIMNQIVICKKRSDEQNLLYASCRNASEGCKTRIETFVDYILSSSKKYDIDPWLLASVAYVETKFDPFVVGKRGERGLMQLHPKSKRGHMSKFVKNEEFRKNCEKIVGNCQDEIIDLGAEQLKSSIRECGNLQSGLSLYNTGHCKHPKTIYINKVLKTMENLEKNGGKKNIKWCSQ